MACQPTRQIRLVPITAAFHLFFYQGMQSQIVHQTTVRVRRAVGRTSTPVHDTGPLAGLSETASYGCSVVEDSPMRRSQMQVVPRHARILQTTGP